MPELTTSENVTVEQVVTSPILDLEAYLIVDEAAKVKEYGAKYWNSINTALCRQLHLPLVD